MLVRRMKIVMILLLPGRVTGRERMAWKLIFMGLNAYLFEMWCEIVRSKN